MGKWLNTNNHTNNPIMPNTLLQSLLSLSQYPEHKARAWLDQGFIIATELKQLDCDHDTLCAANIYPLFKQLADHSTEDTLKTSIISITNESIFHLLEGTYRMNIIDSMTFNKTTRCSETYQLIHQLRKMLLAMADDIRVVLIKLSERLFYFSHLKQDLMTQQKKAAQRALAIYAPLANRLGVYHIKWKIEDLGFKYLNPEQYNQISQSLNMRRLEREKTVEFFVNEIKTLLHQHHYAHIQVAGRAKHIYSIYKKMQNKKLTLKEIYDISAVRIITSTIADCYQVLSIVHTHWEPLTTEFNDYISHPKPNGYQSIHTTILDKQHRNLEIQIRTQTMHQAAELGVAAHWKYKEGKKTQCHYEQKINWLREILNWQKGLAFSHGTNDLLYQQVFKDRIYVFTPQYDIIDLPSGATPIDFSYYVHTDIGHRCRGAKVNGKIAPLNQTLHTGDCVNILIKKMNAPSRDWLNLSLGYTTTQRAQSKIRHFFREQSLRTSEEIFPHSKHKSLDPYPISLHHSVKNSKTNKINKQILQFQENSPDYESETLIRDDQDLLTHLARCCHPIPGDKIKGYITKNRGITIHHTSCQNLKNHTHMNQNRLTEFQWPSYITQPYPAQLKIVTSDLKHLLDALNRLIDHPKQFSLLLKKSISDQQTLLQLRIKVHGLHTLHRILKKIKQIKGVIDAKREINISK